MAASGGPQEIRDVSIIIGHWGDEDCISAAKDIVVPTITPIQHDLPRFGQRLQPAMRKAGSASFARTGPLLLFAGGITSFGASQARLPPLTNDDEPRPSRDRRELDGILPHTRPTAPLTHPPHTHARATCHASKDNIRPTGNDSVAKQQKWLTRVTRDRCARPDVSCREIYSMGVRQARCSRFDPRRLPPQGGHGHWRLPAPTFSRVADWRLPDSKCLLTAGCSDDVAQFTICPRPPPLTLVWLRQAVWRQKLYLEPDMRIVSAGIPDYLTAVPNAHFCLHTEGNGWGARVVDYMAMECLPLMINDRMIYSYANVIEWKSFAMHLLKRQIPDIPRWRVLRS